MGIIIDGKHVADKITEDLKLKIESMDKKPHLTVIQVGNNPASTIYVGLKKKKSEAIGIKSTVINLPETVSEVDLIDKIEELNIDLDVDAILVQLPLPKHISEETDGTTFRVKVIFLTFIHDRSKIIEDSYSHSCRPHVVP